MSNFLELLEKDNEAILLDCGCNNGEKTIEFASMIGTKSIYGVDIDKDVLKWAKKRGIKARFGDLNYTLPFQSNFFDVVCANQVIEHLFHVDTFVSELFRILKPGKYAVVSTENLSSYDNIFSLMLGFEPFSDQTSEKWKIGNPLRPHYMRKQGPFGHVKVFAFQGLKEIFQIYGFSIEKTLGACYPPSAGKMSRFLASLDPRHARFITMKVRKRKYENSC